MPPAAADVYFGVHTTARRGGRGERARSNTIAALGCLFAELDAKDFAGGKAEALAHIEALSPAPSALVDSGGGYHAYWLLSAPWLLTSPAERERARRLQARWVPFVGGDPGAKDLARVLRVPGTLNTKYDPPRPVELVYLDEERRYTFEDLEALAPEPEPAPRAPAPIRPVAPGKAAEGRESARDVIARFNAEHSVESLLSGYGATRTADGWACNCNVPHEHDTQLAITSGGRAVFYSARCGWAPSRIDRNGRPIADAFELYTQVEHGGDRRAALKAYNPIAPAPRTWAGASEADAAAARRQEADRKRQARLEAVATTMQIVRDRAAEDPELATGPTCRRVLGELLDIAGSRDWCRPSVATLAARLGLSERTIQRALKWLEGRYIVTETYTNGEGEAWSGGTGTARRTFLREPLRRVKTPQSDEGGVTSSDAPVSPESREHELVLDHSSSGASEPAPPPPAPVADDDADLARVLAHRAETQERAALRRLVEELAAAAGEPTGELPDALDALQALAEGLMARLDAPAEEHQPDAAGATFNPAATPPPPLRLDERQGANWALLCEHWQAVAPPPARPVKPAATEPARLPGVDELEASIRAEEAALRRLKREATAGGAPWWQYHQARRRVEALRAGLGRRRDRGLAAMQASAPARPPSGDAGEGTATSLAAVTYTQVDFTQQPPARKESRRAA